MISLLSHRAIAAAYSTHSSSPPSFSRPAVFRGQWQFAPRGGKWHGSCLNTAKSQMDTCLRSRTRKKPGRECVAQSPAAAANSLAQFTTQFEDSGSSSYVFFSRHGIWRADVIRVAVRRQFGAFLATVSDEDMCKVRFKTYLINPDQILRCRERKERKLSHRREGQTDKEIHLFSGGLKKGTGK